jgi:hypothetical protein
MKAQSSIEFMTMMGLFMVVFLIFFAVLGDKMVAFSVNRQARLADDMLYFVESEILMAAEAHNGYEHNFTLPVKLAGQDYNLTLNASGLRPELTIRYLELEYARPILVNMSEDSMLYDPKKTVLPNRVWREDELVHVNI